MKELELKLMMPGCIQFMCMYVPHTSQYISSICAFCIHCSITDARGLTEAINNTGRVYEEIGNMHGEQVSSVLAIVCRVYYMFIRYY